MSFRLKNILLLLFSFIRFLFNGRANKQIVFPKQILIVQLAKIGDMVCTTPMFRAIKAKYPTVKVCVIGDKTNKKVLEDNKDVDEYIVFDRNIIGLIKKIRNKKVDFACITGPDTIGLAILYLSSVQCIVAPNVVGGKSIQTKTYEKLKNLVLTKQHRMGSYAPREYLRLLEPLNIITDDTTKHLSFSVKADEKVSDFFKERDISYTDDFIVGISPSAGNKVKKWSEEKFAKIADYIYKKYNAKIILIGESNDVEEVEKMISALDVDTKVINALKVFNIYELKALISKMDMFISVDTGPIYIAEAFKVPTIDITGPIDEKEQPPIGVFHRVVTPKSRKKPELHVMNAREYNRVEALRQIESITVDMVANEVDKLFIKISKK